MYRPARCPEQLGEARLRASSFFLKLCTECFGLWIATFRNICSLSELYECALYGGVDPDLLVVCLLKDHADVILVGQGTR